MTGRLFQVDFFYKDDNFVYFDGHFDKEKWGVSKQDFLNNLEKIYGEGNIYLSDIQKGQRIKINREAIMNRKYYSFIHDKL